MAVSISIAITQNSQSVANNTSNVTVKVNAKWTYGSFNRTAKSGWLTVNGTKYTFTSTFNESESTSGSETIFSKTVNVAHNADGTKTLACSASYTSGVSSGTVTATASKILTTIPRKSSLSASNGTLGTAQTLTVDRKSSSFTHTITYTCGSASGTVATKSSSTSISFTPPLSLASQNTSGTSVSIKFTITTYNGSTNIGSNTKTISCAIPSSVKPTCTVKVEDSMGYLATYGGYLKGLSKFKVTVTPTTSYGSAISAYKTTANGSTYTTASFTTGVLKSSGTLKVSATVTDKRGRSGSASASLTVLDYKIPQITALTVRRCNSDGVLNDQGEYVIATFSATATSLNNKNATAYNLKYKKDSASTYTTVALTDISGSYSVTNKTHIFPADSSSSYDVVIEVVDNFGTVKKTTSASTGFTLIHFANSGRAMAVGKISERDNTFEVGMKMWSAFGDIIVSPMPLSEGQDLNALLTAGYYMIGNTTASKTILNKPLWLATNNDNGTALIEVGVMGDGGQRYQKYSLCSKGLQLTFQRMYYTSSWGDWYIVSGCSGWRNLTISSGFEVYGSGTTPKYRVNGNLITVTGAVKPTATVTSNTVGVEFASGIAEEFRPSVHQQFICQGSGINRWLLSVNTDGKLYVSRYGTTTYVDIAAGAWLIFTATYSI
ncbi:MAG: hypothetical protein IJE92_05920 [Clostridia bacterium]|nr:hypothetical protein [Clostridia bacterium]